jgi:lysophospholipase L1-like esterase
MGGRSFSRQAVRLLVLLGFVGGSVLATAVPAQAAPSYVALGDSYSSGLGTRSYYDDGSGCQRSPYAYPVLDAGRLGASLTFAACSGAKVADVRADQLGGLRSTTRYVTLSVGGNDAGFASVLLQCAQPWPVTCWAAIDNANAFIRSTLPSRLDGLYTAIRQAAPNARVAVVGYPRLFNGEECNLASRISPGEQAELNATADLLAQTIRARAVARGFAFVDPRTAFASHSVCADVEWINGLSNPISESYHPNRSGQSGYASLVEPVLRGSASVPAPAPAP